MYIPFSYLGPESNLCISASGGDDITYLVSGSTVWKMHAFTTPGNHTYQIHSGSAPHKLVIVGAGGSGGMNCLDSLFGSGGGGGAGGFLFLENLPISSGSYNIFVGSGSLAICVDEYSDPGKSGQSSSFDYIFTPTSPDEGYYIPNQKLSAYGGGAGGGARKLDPPYLPPPQTFVGITPTNGKSGASGGGGAITQGYFTNKLSNSGSALYNLTDLPPHGFDGRLPSATGVRAGSGGGASGTGSISPGYPTGGSGVNLLSYIGLNQTVSRGGNGIYDFSRPPIESSNTSGSGGSGLTTQQQDNPTYYSYTRGKNGMVLVLYRICEDELNKCTTYVVNGGVTGGDVTYIPCGGGELASGSIGFDQQTTICTYVTDKYPQSTGTVTLTPSSSCDTEIPITPVPTCDTGSGEQQYATYIYNWQSCTLCYPTPTSCQRQYTNSGFITYTNREGDVVTQTFGGFGPNTGQICAREYPAPTIQNYEPGFCESGTTQIVKTDLICGYYCSGSI